MFSLGVVVGNSEVDDVGDGVVGVVVDGFGVGFLSSSLSYSSISVGVNDDVTVVLLMLGDGVWGYLSPFLMSLR